jgi:hypothetical protein
MIRSLRGQPHRLHDTWPVAGDEQSTPSRQAAVGKIKARSSSHFRNTLFWAFLRLLTWYTYPPCEARDVLGMKRTYPNARAQKSSMSPFFFPHSTQSPNSRCYSPGSSCCLEASERGFFRRNLRPRSSNRRPSAVLGALTSGSAAPSKGSPEAILASRSLIFST